MYIFRNLLHVERFLFYFLLLSSFLFIIRALPDKVIHTALLILVVFVNIWKPATVLLKRQFAFIKI